MKISGLVCIRFFPMTPSLLVSPASSDNTIYVHFRTYNSNLQMHLHILLFRQFLLFLLLLCQTVNFANSGPMAIDLTIFSNKLVDWIVLQTYFGYLSLRASFFWQRFLALHFFHRLESDSTPAILTPWKFALPASFWSLSCAFSKEQEWMKYF